MTERWRKKLGDLDRMGPGDEVFERAKEGPMRQEEPLPRTKTSTRIVTAVAAFAVFALAIAVFAIPALRMEGEPAVGTSAGVLPLWPSQSTDRLDQIQAEADAGTAAWATDPRAVAERFGRDVMGWDGAFAGESMLPAGCSAVGATVDGSSAPGSLTPWLTCLDPMTGECFAGCPSFGPMASSSFSPLAPDGGGGAYRALIVFPCDPRVCNEDPASLHTEDLVLFQPLQQGPGQIWAVLDARSSRIQLSVSAGQNVRDGASIYASFEGVEEPTLGYASCGVAGASSDRTGPVGISMDVSLTGSSECSGPMPGYVWAAQSNKSLASADGTPSADPIAEGGVLSALTAVPIAAYFPTVEVPASVDTTAPSPSEPTTSPAAEPNWQTIDDVSGWTMSFPPDWTAAVFGGQAKVGHAVYSGQSGAPSGAVVDVWTDPTAAVEPADDSSFPLDAGNAISEGSRTFRADGALFHVDVTSDGPLSPEEQQTVRRIVGSIAFEKWRPGDERNGWTALFPVTHDPQPTQDAGISWQSCDQRGCYVLVYYALGFPMGNSSWVLGPITTCGEGENMTADRNAAYAIVLECPNDPTQSWTRVGEPASTNIPGDDSVLAAHPVIRAWDGTLLSDLQATVIPGVSHS